MSSLGLTSDHDPIGQFERLAAGQFYRLVKQVSKLPWFFSFLIFATVGFAYTLVTYFPLVFLRRKITRQIKQILANINEFDERVLMEIHLDYEGHIPRLASVSRVSKQLFVFKPLTKQFEIVLAEYKKAHKILGDHLYPDMETPLTQEEGKELIEAFKPWKENSKHVEFSSNG